MGRRLTDDTDDKSSKKIEKNQSDSDTDSDLDEEEFVVEKILKMRTTKKGKVQCKLNKCMRKKQFFFYLFKIYLNGKVCLIVKIHG